MSKRGWLTSDEIVQDAFAVFSDLRAKRITPEMARVQLSALKVTAATLSAEVEHAKVSKRTVEGSDMVPVLRRGG